MTWPVPAFCLSNGEPRGKAAPKYRMNVSLDPPTRIQAPDAVYPDGRLVLDRLGSNNLVPLISGGKINPALAANNIRVIKDTHGKTSHLSEADIEALSTYLTSLQ